MVNTKINSYTNQSPSSDVWDSFKLGLLYILSRYLLQSHEHSCTEIDLQNEWNWSLETGHHRCAIDFEKKYSKPTWPQYHYCFELKFPIIIFGVDLHHNYSLPPLGGETMQLLNEQFTEEGTCNNPGWTWNIEQYSTGSGPLAHTSCAKHDAKLFSSACMWSCLSIHSISFHLSKSI